MAVSHFTDITGFTRKTRSFLHKQSFSLLVRIRTTAKALLCLMSFFKIKTSEQHTQTSSAIALTRLVKKLIFY